MRALLLIAMMTAAPIQTTPQNAPPGAAKSGIVEGFVRRAGSTEPVADAGVTLGTPQHLQPPAETRQTRTDSNGHFIFRDVPPDKYRLAATREGYYWTGIDRNSELTEVTVTAGQQVKEVVLELTPLAIISGRILGPDGEPMIGVSVAAGGIYYAENGQRSIALGGYVGSDFTGAQYRSVATTDDRGEYRIFWLKPREYYVGVPYLPGRRGSSQVYFPGTSEENGALPVIARPGAETTGINFTLPAPKDVPTFSISGAVFGGPPGVTYPVVDKFYLVRHEGDARIQQEFRNLTGDPSQGKFHIRGVAPGVYDLYPDVRDDQKRVYTARTTLEIRDRSIENLTIGVQSGPELRGRFVVDGNVRAGGVSYPHVTLEPKDGVPQNLSLNVENPNAPSMPLVNTSTGEFTYSGLPAGKYTFRYSRFVMPGEPEAYISDIRQNGSSVMNDGFIVGTETPNPLEVIVSTSVGVLEGTVLDARQNPTAGTRVALVPDPSRRQDHDLYRYAVSDKDGRFTFRRIPPGEYKVFAWDSVPGNENAWFNADFIAQHELRGARVRIDGGSGASVAVTVIPKP